MITDVIAPVESMSLEENHLLFKKVYPLFELRIGFPITDNTSILMDSSGKYACSADIDVSSIEDKDKYNKDGDL